MRRYAQHLGSDVATTHFIIDTSRNGTGPDAMAQYANPPYDQPASVISGLAAGNRCDRAWFPQEALQLAQDGTR
jgi:endoglucanase